MTVIIEGHTSTYVLKPQYGITLPICKVLLLYCVLKGRAEGDGIIRRENWTLTVSSRLQNVC